MQNEEDASRNVIHVTCNVEDAMLQHLKILLAVCKSIKNNNNNNNLINKKYAFTHHYELMNLCIKLIINYLTYFR
jgi:hypothetical protein